jgi:ABC-type bacteriocin/lantibiotic exporter with double-glycine peptidase domain
MQIKNNTIFQSFNYFKLFEKYVGKKIFFSIFLVTLAGISESFGIMMILPLLQMYNSQEQASITDGISLEIINSILNFLNPTNSGGILILIIGSFFFLKGFLLFAALTYNSIIFGELQKKLRGEISEKVFGISLKNYYTKNTGNLVNLVGEQVNRSVDAFQQLAQFYFQFMNAIIYISIAFFVAWKFGLMTVIVGVLLFLFFGKINLYVRQLSTKFVIQSGILLRSYIQIFQSYKYLKATGRLQEKKKNILNFISSLSKINITHGIFYGLVKSIQEPILISFILLIIYVQLVIFNEALSTLLISIILFYRGFNAIFGVQGSFQNLSEKIGSMKLLDDEIQSSTLEYKIETGIIVPNLKKDLIKLNDVNFYYNSNVSIVFRNVNIEIKPFSSTAFVGETGSGKTTLIDLILLIHKPTSGNLTIGNFSSEEINLDFYRSKIGYVSQDMVIFDDTIEKNICLADDVDIKSPEIQKKIFKAAKLANISDFISTLEKGYQTEVGDRGVMLSGGQKQRLFIARELFREPDLLILDEATSALDQETEKKFLENIKILSGKLTLIVVSHRMTTIQYVDTTYELKSGKIEKI